jgi:glycosyltransferase involved in cell wall biosynthesis
MRIAIYFDARPEQGGLFQYAMGLVDCLFNFVPEHTYGLFLAGGADPTVATKSFPKPQSGEIIVLDDGAARVRRLLEIGLLAAGRAGLRKPLLSIPAPAQLKRFAPELVIYVKPSLLPALWNWKAVMPVHDLQHRLQPQFKEVSAGGEFQRRELIYCNSLPQLSAVLVDSETGKEDVLACYPVDESHIFVLPYIAGDKCHLPSAEECAVVRDRYDLPGKYLFYPAAFWPHKNHLCLIEALALLRDRYQIDISLVLSGSKKGGYEAVVERVSQLHLEDRVRFLGYIPDDDMSAVYALSTALVMPTFFGPTNIPVLEAWAAGTPVITSDIRGIREQVGQAGLLVDPHQPEAWAKAIALLVNDQPLQRRLIRLGFQRHQSWDRPQFGAELGRILERCRTL